MRKFNPDKELKRIQYGNRNKIYIVIIIILLIISIGSTYALYQVRYSKRIIYTKVAPFSDKDIELAVYLDGKRKDAFPSEEENVRFDRIDCENKQEGYTTASWDEEKWGLNLFSKGPNKCNVEFLTGKSFKYTGSIQEYTILKSGIYKLEVWGAQGGGSTKDGVTPMGGYGGYSTGEIYFSEGEKIYIVVGGQGTLGILSPQVFNGGYNGGGASRGDGYTAWGGGGGATHIALTTGLLSSLSETTSSILIVAGGGGGAGIYTSAHVGGHAGGYIGVDGSGKGPGYGGTQSAGGRGYSNAGSFGAGGSYDTINNGGGGGAGYYGGGNSRTEGSSGGGGSSYISPSLLNAAMYCYECTESIEPLIKTVSITSASVEPVSKMAKIGDGYANITYLGNS